MKRLAFIVLLLSLSAVRASAQTNTPANTATVTATPADTATRTATPTATPPPTRGITPIMAPEIPRGAYGPTYRFQVANLAAGYNRVPLTTLLPQSGYAITEIQVDESTTTASNATPTGASCAYDLNTLNVAYLDLWCTAGIGGTAYIEVSMIASTPVPTATP